MALPATAGATQGDQGSRSGEGGGRHQGRNRRCSQSAGAGQVDCRGSRRLHGDRESSSPRQRRGTNELRRRHSAQGARTRQCCGQRTGLVEALDPGRASGSDRRPELERVAGDGVGRRSGRVHDDPGARLPGGAALEEDRATGLPHRQVRLSRIPGSRVAKNRDVADDLHREQSGACIDVEVDGVLSVLTEAAEDLADRERLGDLPEHTLLVQGVEGGRLGVGSTRTRHDQPGTGAGRTSGQHPVRIGEVLRDVDDADRRRGGQRPGAGQGCQRGDGRSTDCGEGARSREDGGGGECWGGGDCGDSTGAGECGGSDELRLRDCSKRSRTREDDRHRRDGWSSGGRREGS